MSLIRLAVIVFFINVSKGVSQKSMTVMQHKIMQPYQEIVNKKSSVKFGLGVEAYVSGNAHGAFYSANINLSNKQSIFSLGPCLQKRSLEVNGVKFGYSVLLSGSKDRLDEEELKEVGKPDVLELRLHSYMQYTHEATLSYNASRVETITNPESKINYCQVRFSTLEIAICPELDITIKKMRLRTYMGFTTFYHFKYMDSMYRPKFSPALVFGVGVLMPHL